MKTTKSAETSSTFNTRLFGTDLEQLYAYIVSPNYKALRNRSRTIICVHIHVFKKFWNRSRTIKQKSAHCIRNCQTQEIAVRDINAQG